MSSKEGQQSGEEPIQDSSFYIKLIGMRAIILYPALTTPCLVDKNGLMQVVIALHEDDFKQLEEFDKASFMPGQKMSDQVLLKLCSQLLLVPWGEAHKQRHTNGTDTTNFYKNIVSWRNALYRMPDQAIGSCNAYYLDKVEGTPDKNQVLSFEDTLVSFCSPGIGGVKKPFGTLSGSAIKMYTKAGFKHLFQLECNNCFAEESGRKIDKTMYELVWLQAPLPPDHAMFRYECPGDTVLVKNFEENINKPSGQDGSLLKKNVDTAPQEILLADANSAGAFNLENLAMYRLQNLTAGADRDYANNSQLKPLAYLTQAGGELLYSYHPVYYCESPIEKIGAVSDLHISSKQVPYKLVKAQVIPGADLRYSPFIGKIAHEYLVSTKYLINTIGNTTDILAIAGDIYDHIRNLSPKKCLLEITNATTGKTAKLWNYLDYDNFKEDYETYPKHIDGLMILELILNRYNDAKSRPVFFVTGNHEGYRYPYGISPRITPGGVEIMKANEGVPADHNLTIYEALLMYGESYHKHAGSGNFNGPDMEWVYQVFTPWSNFCVSHDDVNIIGLGWGATEDFLKTHFVGGTSLPRATSSVSESQLAIVNAAVEKPGKKNVLITHFTHINYAGHIPLNTNGDDVAITKTPGMSAEDKSNVGSYIDNQSALLDLMENNKIQYSIAGHSHRGGAYHFTHAGKQSSILGRLGTYVSVDRYVSTRALFPNNESRLSDERLEADFSAALVCPAGGPMSCQNLRGKLKALGMTSPGGLTLDLRNSSVQFTYWEGDNQGAEVGNVSADAESAVSTDQRGTAESAGVETGCPRLAVVIAYLKDLKGIIPLVPVRTRMITTEGGEYEIPTADIVVDFKTGKAEAKLHPEIIAEFGGSLISEVRLHAVPTDTGGLLSPLSLPIVFSEKSGAVEAIIRGSVSGSDVIADDLAEYVNSTNHQFFVSIHFTVQKNSTNAHLQHYDTASPWCLPTNKVTIDQSTQELLIGLNYLEKPSFGRMRLFSEYRPE